MVSQYVDGKIMVACCCEDVNPAGLHRRPRPVRMHAGAVGIALFAPSTRTTPHAPRFVIAVEKKSDLKIDYQIIEFIDNLIPFLPMAVD